MSERKHQPFEYDPHDGDDARPAKLCWECKQTAYGTCVACGEPVCLRHQCGGYCTDCAADKVSR